MMRALQVLIWMYIIFIIHSFGSVVLHKLTKTEEAAVQKIEVEEAKETKMVFEFVKKEKDLKIEKLVEAVATECSKWEKKHKIVFIEPELVFKEGSMPVIKSAADYMDKYQILTINGKTGNGQIRQFKTEYIKTADDLMAKLIAEEEEKIGKILTKYTRTDGIRRRLLLNDTFAMNDTRRRLAIGALVFSRDLSADENPQQSSGILHFTKYSAPYGGEWGWRGGDGSGAVIHSDAEFDFVLTAGHNLYCHHFDRDRCLPFQAKVGVPLAGKFDEEHFDEAAWVNQGVPALHPYRFATDISFNLFPGNVITHPAANMRRAWIPVYKGFNGDYVMNKHPLDYAVIKYARTGGVNPTHKSGHILRSNNIYDDITLVAKLAHPLPHSPMIRRSGVVPDAAATHPHDPGLYFVNPYYTRPSQSGAPLFIGNTHIIAAVHVGTNGADRGLGQRSVHNRIYGAKTHIISDIIAGQLNDHTDIFREEIRANMEYDNIINHFAHQRIQNKYNHYDDEQYVDDVDNMNVDEDYFNYQPLPNVKYIPNSGMYGLLLILCVVCCGIHFVNGCLCGFGTAFVTDKLKKKQQI